MRAVSDLVAGTKNKNLGGRADRPVTNVSTWAQPRTVGRDWADPQQQLEQDLGMCQRDSSSDEDRAVIGNHHRSSNRLIAVPSHGQDRLPP